VLRSYLPILVFGGLGAAVGGAFVMLNQLIGRRRGGHGEATKVQQEPYECGLPTEVSRTFRFGISFYLVAMLFILFDIEVIFLYPVGVILKGADSVFVLGEVVLFVVLLAVAFVYVWRRGALDWR
jgi:NADH-quinone oxidoreductase subunit A